MLFTSPASQVSGIVVVVAVAALFSLLVYFLRKVLRKEEELEEQHREIEEDLEELRRENAFDNGSISDEEVFEDNIESLADQLFHALKEKHGFKVTTFKEMVQTLEQTEKGDEELREELIDFFKLAIKLEYSEKDLSREEEREVKKTAKDLIKRTGQLP
ncbi:MAG: hypothetical protein ABEJ93_02505 [Candidatus Nanohalobium sp.]